MSCPRRRRLPYYPNSYNPQLRELHERYYEVNRRVRDDNPRDVVLLKVQRRRWVMSLTKHGWSKVAAAHYPTVRQLDELIAAWYREHRFR